jgi:MSHA biogenesis protein MshN
MKRRASPRPTHSRAEREYAQGVALLRTGRGSAAERHFAAALATDPAHENARQALVALQIDRGDIAAARALLEQGLAQNPQQTRFAIVLARIYVEQGDYTTALGTLDTASDGSGAGAELHALRGAVLRQLGRPRDAADAYRKSLIAAPGVGTSWIGLALSLEALGNGPEAAEAFRRAVATATLTADLRVQAEARARALE